MEANGGIQLSVHAVPGQGGEAKAFFAAIKRQSSSAMAGIVVACLDSVRIQANDAWLASPHSQQAQLCRDAAAALVPRATRLGQEWRRRLEDAFDAWLLASTPGDEAGRSLSLLSESQLQLQLQLQAAAESIEADLARVLEPMDARLSQLALAASGAQRGLAPLRPGPIGQAFITGFQGEEVGEELRALLVREFAKRLEETLTCLYPELDRQLAQAGYAAHRVGEPRASDKPKAAPPVASTSVPSPFQTAAHRNAWVPDVGMVERREPAPLPSASASLDSQPAALIGQHFVAKPAGSPVPVVSPEHVVPADPASSAAATYSNSSVSAPAKPVPTDGVPMRYRDIIHDHLRHWREASHQPAANDAGAGETILGAQALQTVASLLQGDHAGKFAELMANDGGRQLAIAIRDAVASGARQLGLAGDGLQFAPDQEDAIDLVAILFDAMVHTRSAAAMNDVVPCLYGQLVMPYLKIALCDDSLFNRRGHPARQLLDALTEVCDDGAPEAEGAVLAGGVVRRIVAGYREDMEIFELAVDELRQFQQQQQRRSELAERRAAEAMHGRERLLHARAWARAQLLAWSRSYVASTDAVDGFLQGAWRHAHEQACLRQVDEPTRASQLVELGEALLQLDVRARDVDGPAVAKAWLAISPGIEACCQVAGMDEAMRRDLTAGLVFALAHPATPRSAHALAPEADAGTLADAEPALRLVGGIDAIPHDPALAARMRRLRRGQALRIIDEQGGGETPARVAWISPLTSRLLIVNQRGQRQLVTSPEELASLVQAGRVALSASEAPFDRAMKRLWQQLNTAQEEPVAAAG